MDQLGQAAQIAGLFMGMGGGGGGAAGGGGGGLGF